MEEDIGVMDQMNGQIGNESTCSLGEPLEGKN